MAKPLMEQLTFSVRRATDADKKSIWQVQTSAIRELCGTHYAHKDILQWSNLLSPKSHGQALREREVFVAEKGNNIVGYGQLNLQHEAIEAIYVSPTCVRLGVGTILLERLEEAAREIGINSLHVCSTLNAVGFYERNGYQAKGKTVYRLPPHIDLPCVRMDKRLKKVLVLLAQSS
jgi:N-acetylglutamate synthase-like GNAT family acetyltransferase